MFVMRFYCLFNEWYATSLFGLVRKDGNKTHTGVWFLMMISYVIIVWFFTIIQFLYYVYMICCGQLFLNVYCLHLYKSSRWLCGRFFIISVTVRLSISHTLGIEISFELWRVGIIESNYRGNLNEGTVKKSVRIMEGVIESLLY